MGTIGMLVVVAEGSTARVSVAETVGTVNVSLPPPLPPPTGGVGVGSTGGD